MNIAVISKKNRKLKEREINNKPKTTIADYKEKEKNPYWLGK